MRKTTVALAVLTIVPLTACSQGPSGVVPPTVTVTSAVTVTAMSTPQVTSESSTSEATPTGLETSAGSAPVQPDKRGSELGLVDFFNPSNDWTEDRYDIGSAKQVRGISTAVSQCSADASTTLELRLANNFDSLEFRAGQGNSSAVSTQTLLVAVTSNGRQAEIKRVPFNSVVPIRIDARGVNALIIQLYKDKVNEYCESGSLTAVLTDVRLT
ncbi:hypothetical protein GCM10009826_17790 [Humibacillus xanthopallidus]